MTNEIFKIIEGYPNYMISNLGRVMNTKRGKTLKHCYNTKGYPFVELSSQGTAKPFLIHRLIAVAYISNPNNYPVVNHIDEDVTNFSIDNLEWCEQLHNVLHSSKCGITLIKGGVAFNFESQREFIRVRGGSRSALRDLIKGERNEYNGWTTYQGN